MHRLQPITICTRTCVLDNDFESHPTWEPKEHRFPLNLCLELSLDLNLNLHSRMIMETIDKDGSHHTYMTTTIISSNDHMKYRILLISSDMN